MLLCFIHEANFYVVFIAFNIIFFLLGLILGLLINRPKKDTKDKSKKAPLEANDPPGQADTLEQYHPEGMEPPYVRQNYRPRDYRSQYHDNYW